jgi:hypothetical protein
MRKRIKPEAEPTGASPAGDWLDLERLAAVEITSEDAAYPIEWALAPGRGASSGGWRAASPGPQTIRLVFDEPQRVRRIWLHFVEQAGERTQEFVLRWSADRGRSFREIVRQQWNFSPPDAGAEMEDYQVDLTGVTELELVITPDIRGGGSAASLARLRVA